MIDLQTLNRRAVREGRRIATERGTTLRALFDDSLAGELARMAVRKRLRKAHPDVPTKEIALAVDEALEP